MEDEETWMVRYNVSGMAVPWNLVHPSNVHESNDRVMSGLPHPVCERRVEGWNIILLQEELGDAFEVSRDGKISTWQLPPKYKNSIPFQNT